MTFGEKVKAERTKLGLNQDELAERERPDRAYDE